ncbi:MAG: GNAT family N-acetyltransferase [Clostridiales bacterium]|nr:GNAT family N-acetyltransferase [Clostridiales bacterium]
MSNILEREDKRVEAATLFDAANNGGEVTLIDDRIAIVKQGNWEKCTALDVSDIEEYKAKGYLSGNVVYVGVPLEAQKLFKLSDAPCKTFAYLKALPPEVSADITIKRLAPSLAEVVRDKYCGEDEDGYSVSDIENIMRTMGVFGAIVDGKLAGFIGRHNDGSMGMLEVFDSFRRRGIGGALERFLIGYVMTFMRVPHCDVYIDNAASLALQEKIGLTPSGGYTFWVPSEENIQACQIL